MGEERDRRLRCLFLAVVAVAAAVAFGACGSSGKGPVEATGASAPSAERPAAESRKFELNISIDNATREEAAAIIVSGEVASAAPGKVPYVDASAEVSLGDWKGLRPLPLPHHAPEEMAGLTYHPERSVLRYGGETYELDPALFDRGEQSSACAEALRRADVRRLVDSHGEKPTEVGSGSTLLRTTSGSLDLRQALRVLRELTGADGCGSQLSGMGLPLERVRSILSEVDGFRAGSTADATLRGDGSLSGFSTTLILHPRHPGDHEYKIFVFASLGAASEEALPLPEPGRPLSQLKERVGREQVEGLEAAADSFGRLLQAAFGG